MARKIKPWLSEKRKQSKKDRNFVFKIQTYDNLLTDEQKEELRKLCEPLNVEIKLTDDDIQEMQENLNNESSLRESLESDVNSYHDENIELRDEIKKLKAEIKELKRPVNYNQPLRIIN